MADNIAPLMFSVAISKLDEKIKKWQKQIEDFASNNGKGYKLKIDFGEADTMLRSLAQLSKTAELTRLQSELDALKKKFRELNSSADVRKTAANIVDPLRRGADEGKKIADTIEQNKKRILDAYTDLMKSLNALQGDRAHALGLGLNIGGTSQMVQDIKAFASELSRLGGKVGVLSDSASVNDAISKYNNYIEVIRMLRNEITNLSKDQERQNKNSAAQKIIDNKSVNEAIYQIAQLEKRLSALRDLQAKAQNSGIMTPNLDVLIKDLERYMQKFQQIVQNGGRLSDGTTTAGMIKAEGDYRALTARITENTRETRLNIAARSSAIALTSALAAEEQRLSQAIMSSTSSMKGQSQILSELKTMATQYFSVWGAKTILDRVIQTGGLLEQQRLSIGAILGDLHQANALFDQIKDLAIRSRFGVVQLDSFSKQLTAYGFKSHELYDWTRRLGDISAATGTEVSRLALALGHVRSEGALTGYTLRQFAMGNVPLLKMLSEQLGVTTAQVREMTRKKQISFEDVTTALKTLTDGNGMFANAQETMSEALNAKFKNLRDAFDLMWGDIAESGIGDTLKSIATNLTELTKSWKPLITDMAAGAAMFGTLKASALLYNSALGKTTSTTLASALAAKQHEAEQLRIARNYRALTTVEQIRMNTAGKLNAIDLRMLLNTQKLRGEELLRAVAMGKVNKQMAISAVSASNLANAEKRLLTNQLQQLNGLRRAAMMWTTFSNSVKRAAASVVSFMGQMAPLAAIMVLSDAWASKKADEDAIKKRMDDMREQATEGYRNLQEVQKQFAVGSSKGLSDTILSQSIDDMVDKLKDYSATATETFNHAFEINNEGMSVHSLSEQYEILAKALADTTDAYKKYHEMLPLIEKALETSDPNKNFLERMLDSAFGWTLNDNAKAELTGGLTASLEAYTKQVKAATVAENVFLRQRMEVANVLESLGYANVLDMENDELLHLVNTMKNQAPDTFRKFYQLLSDDGKNSLNTLTMSWRSMNEAYMLANYRMRKAGQDLHESMKAIWGEDMQKWPEGWRQVVMMAMNSATGDVKEFADLSIEHQNLVRDSFLKPFKITVDSDEAQQRVNNLLVALQNLVGKEWVVNIGVKGEDSFADVDAAQKAYKDAQEKIKQAEKQLRALGNPKEGDTGLSEEAKKVMSDYNKQIARRAAARSIILAFGATPEEPKMKTTPGARHIMDALAKRWQSRVDILKKYRSEMEKYMKVMSREQAIEKLRSNGNYAPMFKENWFSDPNDYIGSIDEAIKKLGDATDKRKELVSRWGAEKEDFLGDEFRKDIERSVSELGRLMSVVAENYDIYKKWLDLTGDSSLASRIAGVAQNSSLSDWLTNKMSEELTKVGDTRSASEIFNLTESEIKKLGKDSAIYKIWDSWQNNRLKVEKESLAAYEKAIKSAMTYADRVAQINGELERQNKLIQENKSLSESEKNRAISINNANAQMKVMQMSNDFSRFFNGFFSESRKQIQKMADTIKNNYNTALRAGAITAKEYADKISEINKRMRELEKSQSKTRAYLQGGLNGYYQNKIEKGRDMYEQGAQMYQDAETILNTSSDQKQIAQAFKDSEAGQAMMEMGQGMEAMGGEMMQTVAIIDMIVHGINDLVQGLKGTFDEIREMYDALGHDTNTDSWEDWNTFWSSFSDASNSATKGWDSLKNGNVGGVIEGVVGSFTGWITGFAKGHDKKRQNHIDALMRNVKALDANTEAIKTFRDRTLGYDLGDNRRSVADQYAPDNAKASALSKYWFIPSYLREGYDTDFQKAMHQFYQENSVGTGYAQELENLKKKREDYIKMYEEEADKKKSSEEALLEYKQQIAELDDQIRYFTQDLAKELWSIDLKSWAQQLSDALATAFENGTDMAKAYKEAVTSILQSLASKMMQLAIIEPMMDRLQTKLFGIKDKNGNWSGGVFNIDDPTGSAKKVTDAISDFFGTNGEGQKTITAAQQFLTAFEQGIENAGLTLFNKDQNTLSNAIQGTSEETSGLLAGYVNALRQDVAVKRLLLTQFITEYWPAYLQQITGIHTTLQNIDRNVAAIQMLMSENGALYELLAEINSHLEHYNTGIEQIHIA